MMAPYFPYGKGFNPCKPSGSWSLVRGRPAPLLQQLLDAPFVQLLGVADLDLNQPGIALARARRAGHTVHGSGGCSGGHHHRRDRLLQVRESLRSKMVETGNTHTLIMHEAIALLMMSLSAGRLVTSKHSDLEYS